MYFRIRLTLYHFVCDVKVKLTHPEFFKLIRMSVSAVLCYLEMFPPLSGNFNGNICRLILQICCYPMNIRLKRKILSYMKLVMFFSMSWGEVLRVTLATFSVFVYRLVGVFCGEYFNICKSYTAPVSSERIRYGPLIVKLYVWYRWYRKKKGNCHIFRLLASTSYWSISSCDIPTTGEASKKSLWSLTVLKISSSRYWNQSS